MTRIVVPSWCSSRSSSRMDAPVAESRFPVGSSAITSAGRPAGQGAGDRGALLLAARELAWAVPGAVAEPDLLSAASEPPRDWT